MLGISIVPVLLKLLKFPLTYSYLYDPLVDDDAAWMDMNM